MNHMVRLLALILLVSVAALPAFGWGNATHMHYAHVLGIPNGAPNLREMYGSVLPDAFNYMFDANGAYLYDQTHMNATPFYTAASTNVLKETALGFLSHNGVWGADFSAHASAWTAPGTGYAVAKGAGMTPLLVPVLVAILTDAGLPEPTAMYVAEAMAPELGHDLVETGVDLLVKRNVDPFIGARMVLAARSRPVAVGQHLAAVYAPGLAAAAGITLAEAQEIIVTVEAEYRELIIQYGAAFCLPEEETVAMLAEQMAPLAEGFIEGGLLQNGITQPDGTPFDVTVTPEQVAGMITSAIGFVEGDYLAELEQTLNHVRIELAAQISQLQGQIAQAGSHGAARFTLGRNYPNPFNPSTTVGYTLPSASHVKIVVYNSIGQEVASLVNADMPAGDHAVTWNAIDVPSGAYFYRMEAGSFSATKRMLLVK